MSKLEDLVLSIEQMSRLRELGVIVKNSPLCWYKSPITEKWKVLANEWEPEDFNSCNNIIPALTLQELKQMLPKDIEIDSIEHLFYLESEYRAEDGIYKMYYEAYKVGVLGEELFEDKSEINCAYKMLCRLAENGFLKNK